MKSPDNSDLYGGVAGVRLDGPGCDLGEGVQIRPTFAHLMAPFLMAFAPAEAGKPHPAPWRAVSGGLAIDIKAEIFIPKEFSLPKWFDRVNTVWWLAALLRIKVSQLIRVPVMASSRYESIAALPENDVTFWPVETESQHLLLDEKPRVVVTPADLDWVREHWIRGGQMAHDSEPFNLLVQAFADANRSHSPALAMVSLWAAVERLFSPARTELRFRVSALIASYLEAPGIARHGVQRDVARLYDARSAAAHGGSDDLASEVRETYRLVRRILVAIL
jgi:hypothetical protein